MLDTRADSIIYLSQVKFAELVDDLVTNKRLGKSRDLKWEKVLLIRRYLKALEFRDHLDDITQANYILEQLILLTGINEFPATPTLLIAQPPAILYGRKGDTGDTGGTGATGATGLATDFLLANTAVTAYVDSFLIASAKGARWDYLVTDGVNQRAGSVIGDWLSDGSTVKFTDLGSTEDIGDTSGIEFNVVFSGGAIKLQAVITTGNWTINGSRYFIPNNGNGSGPISDVLTLGKIYIGDASNQAAQQTMSGDVTITSGGVTSITAGCILDSDINAAAAIAMSKLAAMTASKAVVTDGSGFLTVSAATATEVSYLVGVTSSIQTQLDSKLSGVTGAISPWTASNFGTANVVAISDGSSKLAVSTVTTTELSYLTGASSNIQTQLNAKQSLITGSIVTVPSGSPTLNYKVIAIGTWNMYVASGTSTTSPTSPPAHGLTFSKIRDVSVVIVDDAGSVLVNLISGFTIATGNKAGTIAWDSTTILLQRVVGAYFDSASFTSGVVNRGYVTILYES